MAGGIGGLASDCGDPVSDRTEDTNFEQPDQLYYFTFANRKAARSVPDRVPRRRT